ncbi:MAG: domain S-box protein, partial [Segetibacter sp.]|nr:domain S-box protein [Segetibacter sp.]
MIEKTGDFKVFESMPGNSLILLPNKPTYTILAASNDFVNTTGISRNNLLHNSLFEIYSDHANEASATSISNLSASFKYVITHKKAHQLPIQPYQIQKVDGTFKEFYWHLSNSPVVDDNGELLYIIHSCKTVTEKTKPQQKEHLPKQNFEQFFNQSHVPFAVLKGKDFVFTFANPAYIQLLNGREIVGKPLHEAIPELEGQPFLKLLEKAFDEGVPHQFFEIEATALFDESNVATTKYFNLNYVPYKNEAGETEGILAMGYDVTEQVLMSKRETRERLNEQAYNLFMQAPVGICILKGENFVIELANEPVLQIWGKSASIIGKPVLEALPEIEGQGYVEILNEVKNTGQSFYANENVVFLDREGRNEKVYVNFVYQPYYENDGTIAGVLAIVNEVTEQVIARIKAEESEKRFRNLVEEAPVATTVFFGEEMIIQLANDTMLRTWGKDNSVIGKRLNEALPELKGQPFLDLLKKVYKTGITYTATEDRADLVVDGKLQSFYFNFTYKALRNVEGQIYGILNMAIDVTDLVVAKQKLQESEERLENRVATRTSDLQEVNEQLERTNKELEQFTYAASHDMQEPLRKVQIFTNFLLQRNADQLNEAGKNLLEKIVNSAGRMKNIIDDLLQYSHQTQEDQEFELTDLNKIVENIEADLELMIEQKNASIIKERLPVICVVAGQINQLFYNLFTNALKFAKTNTDVQITISAKELSKEEIAQVKQLKPDQSYVQISFVDNGIGFEQEYAEKIFNLFQRLHGRTEYDGTGIGLAL